jgi:hypothetical protein
VNIRKEILYPQIQGVTITPTGEEQVAQEEVYYEEYELV